MADNFIFKMFISLILLFLISGKSFSLAVSYKEEKCGCYSICNKNFTMNTVQDVQKISACQRGCRFFSLVLHTSHEPHQEHDLKKTKEDCLLSCFGAYISPVEMSSCQFGCAAVEMSRILCNTVEIQTPQMTYSFVIEESDILIHPGEPEPDDALMDPGLQKQIQKTLAALLDATPKIPEIRFTNLPIKTERPADYTHGVLKCSKLYGFNPRLEFRNVKVIMRELYLLIGVSTFVFICLLFSYYCDMKRKQLKKKKKIRLAEREPLIHVEIDKNEDMFCHETIPAKLFVSVFHDEKSIGREAEEKDNQFHSFLKI